MNGPRSLFEEAFHSLAERGVLIEPAQRRLAPLRGVRCKLPGRQDAFTPDVDTYTLHQVGKVYAGTPTLRSELKRHGATVGDLAEASGVVRSAYENDRRLVWGFSGYSSSLPGIDYRAEAHGMERLFSHLSATHQLPSLVCDGGVAEGTLGLSGLLAEHYHVPTLRYVPLEGLGCIGSATHLVAHKATFQEREIFVALTGDILVCFPGGPGTIRECEVAIDNGVIVLCMLSDEKQYRPDSLPALFMRLPKIRKAFDEGQLFVCWNESTLKSQIASAISAARRSSVPNRSQRFAAIGDHFQ